MHCFFADGQISTVTTVFFCIQSHSLILFHVTEAGLEQLD